MRKVAKVTDKASKALAIATKVARLINVEIKHFDTSTGTSWLNPDHTTGSIGSLFNISQGTSVNTRTGDSIKLYGVNIKGLAATGGGAQFFRVLLVRGLNERGTAPALNTIYSTTGSQAIMHSLRNVDWDSTYKILAQRTIFFPSNSGDYESRRYWNINMRLSHHIVYNKGANSAETGGLYLVFLSDAASNIPNVQYTARLRFIDN